MKQLDALDRMVDLEALETAVSDNMEEDSSFDMGGDSFDDSFGGEPVDTDVEPAEEETE